MEIMLMIYVSGSAYKIIQHRAYHHGTMLISSSLGELGKALKSSSVSPHVHALPNKSLTKQPNIETKGIPSFRSPVTTLNHYLSPDKPQIDHDHSQRPLSLNLHKSIKNQADPDPPCK
jgi:lipoate-protein ligase A